jgi:hypothetical protein
VKVVEHNQDTAEAVVSATYEYVLFSSVAWCLFACCWHTGWK